MPEPERNAVDLPNYDDEAQQEREGLMRYAKCVPPTGVDPDSEEHRRVLRANGWDGTTILPLAFLRELRREALKEKA